MASADTQITWHVKRDQSAQWSARLKLRVTIETETFANNVLAEAQENVKVRSGGTRDSGTVEQVGSDPIEYVVKFGGAALYLEFGTAKQPAYPFLKPAAANHLGAYLARLAQTTQGRVVTNGMMQGFS